MRLKSLLLLCLMSSAFVSCEKETQQPTESKSSIEGLWIGTYTTDAAPQEGAQYFSFILKPGGKLVVESHPKGVQYFAVGTWTLNGTALSCDHVYPSSQQGYSVRQTATAKFDQSGKLTEGVWTNIGAPGGTGKFTLNEIE